MLKSWSIQNFKPILDSGDLKLAPVTVLAGRNSSGKSSLIQSILMIAQTLSNRILDRALLPNGPIVQLGTFEDILSEQTNLRTLVVGFELEIGKEASKEPPNRRFRLVEATTFTELSREIESLKVTSQFRSASNDETNNSAIEASKVNVERVSLEVTASPFKTEMQAFFNQNPIVSDIDPNAHFDFKVDINQLSVTDLRKFCELVSPQYLRLVPYTPNEPNYQATFTSKSKGSSPRVPDPPLIAFSHFLPNRLIGKYIIEERRKLNLTQAINFILSYPNENLPLLRTLLISSNPM